MRALRDRSPTPGLYSNRGSLIGLARLRCSLPLLLRLRQADIPARAHPARAPPHRPVTGTESRASPKEGHHAGRAGWKGRQHAHRKVGSGALPQGHRRGAAGEGGRCDVSGRAVPISEPRRKRKKGVGERSRRARAAPALPTSRSSGPTPPPLHRTPPASPPSQACSHTHSRTPCAPRAAAPHPRSPVRPGRTRTRR